MSITPYETLAVAPKSQEASIHHLTQQHKEAGQQAQIATSVQQQQNQKMERTEKMSEKDATPFHYDAKEKGRNEYERRKQEERKKKEEQKKAEDRKKMLGCTFEISV